MAMRGTRYAEHPSCAALRPYVECFWSRISAGPAEEAGPHRVLPDGCMDIIFNFGEAWLTESPSGSVANRERSYVVGTMSRPVLVGMGGRVEFLGVRFRPAKAHLFLRLPAVELTNRSAALDNLWGRAGKELEARLVELPTFQQKLSHLEQELLHRLPLDGKQDSCVDAAIDFVLRSRGASSVKVLSTLTGISRQYLARKFAQYVGVSPKLFCRVIRFQNLLKQMKRSEPLRWSTAAQELGYYDQAHMIWDCKEFSGLSPEKYRLSH